MIRATVIKPNQDIKLRARQECVDRLGESRVTSEEWLVKNTGTYLPGAYEEVVDVVNAYALPEKVKTDPVIMGIKQYIVSHQCFVIGSFLICYQCMN